MKTFTCLVAGILVAAVDCIAQPKPSKPQQSSAAADISTVYQQMLSAMRSAKSKEEIVKAMDAFDAPDWIGVDPTGKRTSRQEAMKALETLVANPSDKRVLPDMEVVWMNIAGGKASVLMWVSLRAKITDHQGQFGEKGKSHEATIGALVRDSLTLTPKGWRRTMHEKILPDQPLTIDGSPRIHIPGTAPLAAAK